MSDRSPAPTGPHGTDGLHPVRRTLRTWISRLASWTIARAFVRVRLEGRDRLPAGPAIYCFNHLSWADPFILMAVLPMRPRNSSGEYAVRSVM